MPRRGAQLRIPQAAPSGHPNRRMPNTTAHPKATSRRMANPSLECSRTTAIKAVYRSQYNTRRFPCDPVASRGTPSTLRVTDEGITQPVAEGKLTHAGNRMRSPLFVILAVSSHQLDLPSVERTAPQTYVPDGAGKIIGGTKPDPQRQRRSKCPAQGGSPSEPAQRWPSRYSSIR